MPAFAINPSPDKNARMRNKNTSNQILALKRKEIHERAAKMRSEKGIGNLIEDKDFKHICHSKANDHRGAHIDLNDAARN